MLAVIALDFAGTLLATLIGAAIALAGANSLNRREQAQRYTESVDGSVAALVEEASVYRRDLADWHSRHSFPFVSRRITDPRPAPDPRPSVARFRALLHSAALTAKGDERRVFSTARDLLRLLEGSDRAPRGDRVMEIAEALVSWRELEEPPSVALGELAKLRAMWQQADVAEGAAE